ncbi:hypothetical protein D3C78_1829700 [compost metagenome]
MGGGKPRGVFQHVDQRLFDQRRMHEQQRQLPRHFSADLQRRQHRAQAIERTADDVRR